MATANLTVKPVKSKTSRAIAYMQAMDVSAAEAARIIGVDAAAVYKRLKVLEATAHLRCAHCGQLLQEDK